MDRRAEPVKQAAAEPRDRAGGSEPVQEGLPDLEIDLGDPAGLIPSPTVLSVPASIMSRFETARGAKGASHTGLVLDALRASAARLVELVTGARPGPQEGDLFPWRPSPGGKRKPADRPVPLRVRPTIAELRVIDRLTDHVNAALQRQRPGSAKVSRSEVVAAALDAFLPQPKRRRDAQAGQAGRG